MLASATCPTQRQDAKQASLGKFQRTDTDRVKEQFTRNTQDSAQTGYNSPDSQLSEQELEAQEDIDGGSGTEVDGPIADDKYIKGTRLVVGGWFQACRGCNEPTAHSAAISKREVPLCPRCQDKYMAMVTGCYPPSSAVKSGAIEPLHYWLPRLLAPVPRLTPEQRRDFCDTLVLCQDDAWLQLINMS
eukprot:GHRR01009660.1.p1 GENE.GHRR01009660.1~~GHRR01009660.1.p1  ORF type:complete len:188 (+),score=59.06 GHRR01009660.1:595-1158(+)